MERRTTALVHQGRIFSVPRLQLMASCGIFDEDPALLARPYQVKSQVSAANFRLFVRAIEGSDADLTHENSPALKLLCDEFKFRGLGRIVQAFTDCSELVCEAETVHIERDKLVRTCSKFRDCRSLLTRPYEVTSSIGADVFRVFVNAIDGVSPTLTNENITDIGLLCDEFGYEQLSATVAEFLAQYSSPGERACREIVVVKAQIAALKDEIANMKAENLRQG
jgi:Na+-transporting NADH:ubiquinone oxidoreductase subunit NqrA